MTTVLRIACAWMLLTAIWVLALPAEPTLFADLPGPATETFAPVETAETGESARTEAATAVRQILPSPVAPGGELRRLPNASSGAAAPARTEAEAPPADAPDTVLPVEPAREAAVQDEREDEAAPEFRLFALPIAIDSATLRVGETTVRIAGVEPVAPEARCGEGAQSWPCGARARTAFRYWLRGRPVLCRVPAAEARAADLAVPCLMGEEDVGAWLVRNGWASASPGSRYEEDEARAREARIGVWSFQRPD